MRRGLAGAVGIGASSALALASMAGALPEARAAAPGAGAQALVAAATLQASDFPPGWIPGPPATPTDYAKYGSVCRRFAAAVKRRIAHGGSARFQRGTDTEVNDTVAAYRTSAEATAVLGQARSSSGASCLTAGLRAAARQAASQAGATVTSLQLTPVSINTLGADHALGYEGVVVLAKSGQRASFFADLTLAQVGTVDIAFAASNLGSSLSGAFDPQFQAAVTRVRQLATSSPA